MDEFFPTHGPKVPKFPSGEVASMLGWELWRLHRFLARYSLTSAGQLGRGRGSRRVFTQEDVYRIAIAKFLIADGLTPKLVADIVQSLEDREIAGVDMDESGAVTEGVFLRRDNGHREHYLFTARNPPEVKLGGPVYYALRFADVIEEVKRRISEFSKTGKE
jgi:DNA-binding transcriptional MerR regulator